MKTRVIGALVVALMLTGSAAAQEKPVVLPPGQVATGNILALKPEAVPLVSEIDALKLDKALLVEENLQLRIAQLQEQVTKNRADVQALIAALLKPGYDLGRNAAGAWVYTAKLAPVKLPEKK